ncbi:hypothetical protein FF124_01165 [Martelella lutilitoris]|uniref:Uncharacterized protein n=1 Tax=Martelella lutilitoris TaxID=2583532 RepID=A0A5C4JWR7_9HYPH|nr:hypothetical protein [Martelella lutilitoris]TNB49601.1 hypothetical protein FF124_01165 [Martelella lutilitoris]
MKNATKIGNHQETPCWIAVLEAVFIDFAQPIFGDGAPELPRRSMAFAASSPFTFQDRQNGGTDRHFRSCIIKTMYATIRHM